VKTYLAELHIHTVLSPCAEVEMIPPLIVQEALDKGVHLIAISDHNSSANVLAVQKAAQGTDLIVLPGIEIQTKEEVHILCLFDRIEQLADFQMLIDHHMPPLCNDPEHFGEQFVVDESGEFVRRESQLLITSVNLTIETVFEVVNEIGGLAIPAHVDRKAYGLLAILGFIPTDIHVDAVEVSRNQSLMEVDSKFPQISGYPVLVGGDAHRLEEILGANVFIIEEPTIEEIRKALRAEDNRSMYIRSI
jgi:3',5'-nucleoside bisphosphate phosphatase